ncbi:MAG: GIY-YIG nuclease family protein [Candidatus Thorarchaeota archaeon SMTZ1-45]|nr:MAG: hypothetical protein AM325_03495 [Candidatus Thorarchaeota archaeon SMTZ1-45]
MKGAYVLIIRVKQPVSVQIKSLGNISFDPGEWIYIGSAMGDGSTSLENRLERHFRKDKTIYWHIDYLLDSVAELVEAIWTRSSRSIECDLVHLIDSHNDFIAGPNGFGSSDCKRGSSTHIYFYQGNNILRIVLIQSFQALGFQPSFTQDGQI